MILWTIQNTIAYEKMQQTGVLRADSDYILDELFRDSYLWMAEQMKKRVGPPPEGVIFPVWAWYQWEGSRKQKATGYEIIVPFDENVVYSEEEKKKSWENIFDIDCSFDGEKHPTLSTQATIWEVKSEWVKKAEHFKSR